MAIRYGYAVWLYRTAEMQNRFSYRIEIPVYWQSVRSSCSEALTSSYGQEGGSTGCCFEPITSSYGQEGGSTGCYFEPITSSCGW